MIVCEDNHKIDMLVVSKKQELEVKDYIKDCLYCQRPIIINTKLININNIERTFTYKVEVKEID